MSQGCDKALKPSLLTAGFWGNLLWTWNQTLPFRAKSLLLSLLSKVSFMVERKNPSARGLSLCRTRARRCCWPWGQGLWALPMIQIWGSSGLTVVVFWELFQISPFITDFYLQIFPHPFCNLTNFSIAVKMEQVKVSFKGGVFQLQWAGLNIHFRWSVG